MGLYRNQARLLRAHRGGIRGYQASLLSSPLLQVPIRHSILLLQPLQPRLRHPLYRNLRCLLGLVRRKMQYYNMLPKPLAMFLTLLLPRRWDNQVSWQVLYEGYLIQVGNCQLE
jgi:hypothetical protein